MRKDPTTGGPNGSTGGPDGNGSNVGTAAFEITSTDILLARRARVHEEVLLLPHPEHPPFPVNKWISDLTPGSHHMIMFLNPGGSQLADGTIDDNCGIGGGGNLSSIPVWTFATQTPHLEVDLPSDNSARQAARAEHPRALGGSFKRCII